MLKCAAKLLLEREEGLQGGVRKQDSAEGCNAAKRLIRVKMRNRSDGNKG